MNTSRPALSLNELADERIAACVAACEDIDTETLLQRGVASFASILERLNRYQDFTFRLSGVLGRVHARGPDAPSRVDLAVLATLRVEAVLLLRQESQPEERNASH